MSSPTIREATPADDEAVAAIVTAAYQHTGIPFLEDARSVAQRRARGAVYVAEDRGRVVGTFTLTPGAFLTATMERFAVTPHHHRRSIGDAMAAAAVEAARALGYYVLTGASHPTMTAAHRLYQQVGATASYLPDGIYYTLDLRGRP